MFSPKILPKNEYSLRIMDNKALQQLSKADKDIFVREYFKEMNLFLRGPIGIEPRDYKYYIGNIGEPFMEALYKQVDYTVIESHLLDTYKNIVDWVKKTKSPTDFSYGFISHFLFRLNLIINNFYPDKNNPQFDLVLDKLTRKRASSSFKRFQGMIADPLTYITQAQQDELREKVQLFLIGNRDLDRSVDFIQSMVKIWLKDYPSRVNHAEIIKTAFVNDKEYADLPGIPVLTEKLLTVFNELTNLEVSAKDSASKLASR